MASTSAQWQDTMWLAVQERNRIQTEPFKGVYQAFASTEKKYRLMKQKHTEIRNRIGILQYETQEAIKAGNPVAFLDEMKVCLLGISDDLSPRSMKNYDDVKIRIELNKTIKDQHSLIVDLKEEVAMAKSELSASHEEAARLQDELSNKTAIIETLQSELESSRSFLESAETRLRKVEAENVQLAQRVMEEKQKNVEALNEMNRMMQANPSAGGILGGGFSFMKKIGGAAGLFAAAPRQGGGSGEFDEDFVDLKAGGEDDARDLPLLLDVCPPRQPLVSAVCHSGEINDIVFNKHFFMTAGSDSTVKIFEKKIVAGADTGFSGTAGLQIGQIDPRHSLPCGGPPTSLDLKGEWLAAGCCDNIGRIWNVKTGRLRHNLSGHANKVTSVRLVGTGEERAVTGSADRIVRYFDIVRSQANILCALKSNSRVDSGNIIFYYLLCDVVSAVAVSSDCCTVASGHQDGGLRIWNIQMGTKTHLIPKLHQSHITSVEFDPKRGNKLLTASRDNTLTVIDMRTFEPLLILRAPGLELTHDWSQVAFSPDSSMIVAGSTSGKLFLWDAESGNLTATLPGHTAAITSVFWGDTGVMTCDREGCIVSWGG